MFLIEHFLFSVILSIFFFPIFKWQVWLIVAGATLIDLDHLITNFSKFKNSKDFFAYFSKQFRFFMRKPESKKVQLYVFHSIEFLVVLIILSLFFKPVLLIAIGVVFHLILDLISDTLILKRYIRCFSIIQWIRKRKGL